MTETSLTIFFSATYKRLSGTFSNLKTQILNLCKQGTVSRIVELMVYKY